MYGLKLDNVNRFVVIVDGYVPAIYESVEFFKTEAYGKTFPFNVSIPGLRF